MQYLFYGIMALTLSACVSMPMDQCKYLDWRTAGRESAKSGEEFTNLAALKQMCGQQGIVVDEKAFHEGREEGLRELCSYKGGFELGVAGKSYSGACPAAQSEDFIRGFREGAREFREKEAARQENQREEDRAERERLYRRRHDSDWGDRRKNCTFDSDCQITDNCSFGKCGGNGKACSFDSDCSIQGQCEQGVSATPSDRPVNFCRYH